MKNKIIICLVLVAIIGLSGLVWYQSKLNSAKLERENTVSRVIKTTNLEQQTLKSGTFIGLDPAHYAKGSARITQDSTGKYLELGDDFATNPDGPDLYVWLVKKQTLGGAIGGVDTDPASYLSIGPLDAKSGKQIYNLNNLDIEGKDYAVVIWCKAFGVQFSNAVLK